MALEPKTDDGDPLKFILKSKCPHQQGLAFVLQAPSAEVRDVWVSEIRAILDTQLDFLRGWCVIVKVFSLDTCSVIVTSAFVYLQQFSLL